MIKKFLISTIGDDLNITKSLIKVAECFRFDRYCYILTQVKNVKENFRNIKEYLLKNAKIKEKMIETIFLKNIDDFDKIYEEIQASKIKKKLINLKKNNWEIYLDYTYGTKAISGQVLFYLVSNRLVDYLIYISGTRGSNSKVIGNYNPKIFNLSRFYLEEDWKAINNLIKSFEFTTAQEIIKIYKFQKNELSLFLSFYINFLAGKFKSLTSIKLNHLKNNFFKINLKKISQIQMMVADYINNQEKLKRNFQKLKNEDKDELFFKIFRFEIGYFYDQVKIAFEKKNYPEELALFCSFLDKYLTYNLYIKKTEISFDVEFDYGQINFVYKNQRNKITGKKTPVGLSFKLDEFLRLFNDKVKGKFNEIEIKNIIEKRNNSIFGHGFYFPDEEDGKKAYSLMESLFEKLNFEKQGKYFFYYPVNVKIFSLTP